MYPQPTPDIHSRYFDYRHTVCLEETNLLGNVYYVNHVRWQGHCRELFLKEHVPGILKEMELGLRLVTTRCSCTYHRELLAFDQVLVRMGLAESLSANRIALEFKYYRRTEAGDELVAEGSQEIACMRAVADSLVPERIPPALRSALQQYSDVSA